MISLSLSRSLITTPSSSAPNSVPLDCETPLSSVFAALLTEAVASIFGPSFPPLPKKASKSPALLSLFVFGSFLIAALKRFNMVCLCRKTSKDEYARKGQQEGHGRQTADSMKKADFSKRREGGTKGSAVDESKVVAI